MIAEVEIPGQTYTSQIVWVVLAVTTLLIFFVVAFPVAILFKRKLMKQAPVVRKKVVVLKNNSIYRGWKIASAVVLKIVCQFVDCDGSN